MTRLARECTHPAPSRTRFPLSQPQRRRRGALSHPTQEEEKDASMSKLEELEALEALALEREEIAPQMC